MLASQERLADTMQLINGQKFFPDKELVRTMPKKKILELALNAGQQERYEEYQRSRVNIEGMGGHLLMDLDHNVEMHRASPLWPCNLTHGCLVHTTPHNDHARIATGMEHLAAHGLFLHEAATKEFHESPLRDMFASLTRTQQVTLAGRGIHVPALSAFIFWVLSNIVVVCGERLPRSIKMRRMSSWEDSQVDVEAVPSESDDEE